MTYITELTGRSSVYSYRFLTMILAGFALLILQPSAVQAQWTTGTNINNTNSGTVSVGTTSPGGDKLIVSGNTISGNIPSHTQLYSGFDSQANSVMELGYGTATANVTPYSTIVLSKNLTSANQLLGVFNFANRSIADGSDKRIVQIAAFTDATTNSGALAFLTMSAGTPNERMRITSTGNVGIGTSSPAGKLDVTRSDGSDLLVRAWNTATASGAAIFRAAASSNGNEAARLELTDNVGFTGGISGDHTNGLTFRTGNQSSTYAAMGTRMTITTAGNVGIGTTTPLYSLDVNGGTNGFRAKAASSSSADTIATFENANGIQAIVRANGNFGIGTTSPGYRLDVQGGFLNSGGGLCIAGDCKTAWSQVGGGSSQWATNGNVINNINTGNVGVGTSNPTEKLEVNGTVKSGGLTITGAPSEASYVNALYLGMSGTTAIIDAVNQMVDFRDLVISNKTFQVKSWNGGALVSGLFQNNAGNVGIGTTSPTKKLDVAGDINASGAITGGTINAKYQDVAEWVRSSQQLSAGTVVVLDQTKSNQVIASSKAYDTRVAGVISIQPGITLGENGAGKVLVATTGRVKVKVDATAGPIQVGDLLVTSDKEGIAKKSEPLSLGGVQIHRPGTLIGKALEPLDGGTGIILVLLSLQ